MNSIKSLMRNTLVFVFLVAMAPWVLSEEGTAVRPTDSTLRGLMDRVWDFELVESPLLATDVGDGRGQDRLAHDSFGDMARRDKARAAFLDELASIPLDSLSSDDQVDHDLLGRRLERAREDYRLGLHLMPINNREGFHISFPELPRLMNPDTAEEFKDYIARLYDFSRYTDEQIALMTKGIETGFVQPAIIMRQSASQAEAQVLEDAEQSLFLTDLLDESIAKLKPGQWDVIRPRVIKAIRTSVIPSYKRFADFLRDTYVPACRGSIAARVLPGGQELYQAQIRKFTTLDFTPEELHQRGIAENARIRKEMEAICREVKFEGDLPAFLTHLRTSDEFYAKTPEQLLREVAYICKRIDGQLPTLFGKLPRTPYGIREIPAYVAPQTTSAYYWPPATDGSRGGFYYINTYNLSARPLYALESLSLHEAVPGHHLQLALQAELEGLHPMRKQSSFGPFIEGWALYSEKLGTDLGIYKDPYQRFGQLSMEAWRASRLVVDTGMHALGWSRERAIQYMKDNTALSEHNVVAEIDRYIGWPGQALSYKVGELFISEQRRRVERELKGRFDVREFHDVVLSSGSIPLPTLQRVIDDYLAKKTDTFDKDLDEQLEARAK
ncbi:MAG: DUF885 domain-containing protein [Planctomycetota bacterium]